jgi:hypothetical protein
VVDKVMQGGRFSKPVRRGDTVERRAAPSSANVHALLRQFERVGFALAPKFVGTAAGREVLTFIEGETGYPPLPESQRSDEALVNVARAIRAMHDATQGFVPVDPEAWHDLEVAVPARIDCIGHHDLAPWNIVFDGGQVVGIIDWDSIRPSNRVWDSRTPLTSSCPSTRRPRWDRSAGRTYQIGLRGCVCSPMPMGWQSSRQRSSI